MRRFYPMWRISMVTAVHFLLILLTGNSAMARELNWSNVASLSTATSRGATAVVNVQLYLLGGTTDGGPSSAVVAYDSLLNKWQSKRSLSEARYAGAEAVNRGIIHIAGGSTNGTDPVSTIVSYDTSTGASSSVGTLVTARMRASAAILNNKMYVVGGSNNGGTVYDTIEEIDLDGHTSSVKATMTVPRQLAAVVESQGKIYIIGGLGSDGLPTDSNVQYDPAQNTFTSRKPVPVPVGARGAVAADGKIYLIGGITDFNAMTWSGIIQAYDPVNDSWESLQGFSVSRHDHAAGILYNRLYVAGGSNAMDPISGNLTVNEVAPLDAGASKWSSAASMETSRYSHMAVLLDDGRVLIAGGQNYSAYPSGAELYDPVGNRWSAGGSWSSIRPEGGTLTLLSNGKVLVAGGGESGRYAPLKSAELYDLRTNTWSPASSMAVGRLGHTATLLPNGKVLVAGGSVMTYISSAEIYDPATDGWSGAGSMAFARAGHVATLLANGKVLITGGGYSATTAEIYDPETNSWTPAASMNSSRAYHSATLLPQGEVLVAGGWDNNGGGQLSSAERYDPNSNIWTPAGSMTTGRNSQASMLLPEGKVLVAGGGSSELYDPATDRWSPAGAMASDRWNATATLLANGKMLVTGGYSPSVDNAVSSAELYGPKVDTISPITTISVLGGTYPAAQTVSLTVNEAAEIHFTMDGSIPTAASPVYSTPFVIFMDTTVKFFAVDTAGNSETVRSEAFTITSPTFPLVVTVKGCGTINYSSGGTCTGTCTMSYHADMPITLTQSGCFGTVFAGWSGCDQVTGTSCSITMNAAKNVAAAFTEWSTAGSMATTRQSHTATKLSNGMVLVAGGTHDFYAALKSAELYNPANNSWSPAGSMTTPRKQHIAALLADGRVLVAGGDSGSGIVRSAELYNPATNSWSPAGSMWEARRDAVAVTLPDGRVLVVGGYDGKTSFGGYLTTAELYDPASNSWYWGASTLEAHYKPTMTLLADGRVLIVGGFDNSYAPLATAEIYAYGSWSSAGSMAVARESHTATLLSNGKVLVVGGETYGSPQASAELYDPATGGWSPTGSLATPRRSHTATLVLDDKVLVAGGNNYSGLTSAELYDPATGRWIASGDTASIRGGHTATLLASGKVLLAGGYDDWNYIASAELYGPGSPVYDPTPPVSSISPPGGLYTTPRTITLAANEVATIHYTVDGSTPTTDSAVYAGPFTLSSTTTVRFFAVRNAVREGSKSASYTFPVIGGTVAFDKPVQLSLPYKAWGIATTDFNGDGKADLAVANFEQNTVTTYRGNGDGTFTSAQEIAVGAQPTSVTFGVFNGSDSYIDIVSANSGGGSVSYLLGNATNAFSNQGTFMSGTGTSSVAIGHFRNVGPPDMAVTNPTTGYLEIYYGQQGGVFNAGPRYYLGTGVTSVVKGYFNGDTKEDLAVVNYDTGELIVLTGDGAGNFSSGPGDSYATPKYARSVTVGDINNDGKSDLVVVSDGGDAPGGVGTVTILLGKGDGSFTEYSRSSVPQFTCAAAVADFNGDGRADIILTNRSSTSLSVLAQSVSFGVSVRSYPDSVYYSTLQAALADAVEGGVMETVAGDLYENLVFDRNIHVTLRCGVNGNFGGVTGYTILHGSLTISSGTLVAENLIII